MFAYMYEANNIVLLREREMYGCVVYVFVCLIIWNLKIKKTPYTLFHLLLFVK